MGLDFGSSPAGVGNGVGIVAVVVGVPVLLGGGEGDHGEADVLGIAVHVVLALGGGGLEEKRAFCLNG